jgi:hypothetical protein
VSRWGVSGAPVPAFVPFYAEITTACAEYPGGFPPLFLAAIKCNETGDSHDPAEIQEGGDPHTLLLPDGSNAGVSPFQLTASYPTDWRDPLVAARYALRFFLAPAVQFFLDRVPGIGGDALVKCGAAAYNSGEGGAWSGYVRGNVDDFDTDGYGARAVAAMHDLLDGRMP